MITINDLKQQHDLVECAENYIEQNHFGDFLIIEGYHEDGRFRLWNNHIENQKMGEPKYQLEYCGEQNDYKWGTVETSNQ